MRLPVQAPRQVFLHLLAHQLHLLKARALLLHHLYHLVRLHHKALQLRLAPVFLPAPRLQYHLQLLLVSRRQHQLHHQ